jgi:hypothetical protein
MFINLTNHPSADWSEEQLKAAHQYGEVVDLSFHNIKPYYTKEEVLRIVKEYVDMIMQMKDNDTVIHVMGEMTFTYNIVSTLKAIGINCLASTTIRNTVMTPDGKKLSDFGFVQFREY